VEHGDIHAIIAHHPGGPGRELDRGLGAGMMIDRDQDPAQREPSVLHCDEAARSRGHEEAHGLRTPSQADGSRASDPVRKPLPALGGEHHQIGGLLVQVLECGGQRVSVRHRDLLHLDPQLLENRRARTAGLEQLPPLQRGAHRRKPRPSVAAAVLRAGVQDRQSRLPEQGDCESVGECGLARLGEVGGMEYRTDEGQLGGARLGHRGSPPLLGVELPPAQPVRSMDRRSAAGEGLRRRAPRAWRSPGRSRRTWWTSRACSWDWPS
jgi:hypothetical protein